MRGDVDPVDADEMRAAASPPPAIRECGDEEDDRVRPGEDADLREDVPTQRRVAAQHELHILAERRRGGLGGGAETCEGARSPRTR